MNVDTSTILIDNALASGAATALDPEERKLQELALVLRDDAPTPGADFELRMNARVAAGFPPRRANAGGRLRTLAAARPRLAALGAAASLLVALVVALSVIGSNGGSSQSSSTVADPNASGARPAGSGSAAAGSSASGGGSAAAGQNAPNASPAPAEKAAPSASSGAAGAPAIPAPVPGGLAGGRNRKVERSAELVLATPKDKLSDVGDQVIAVTDRYRGFVLHSSVTSAGEVDSSGSFDLRVPVANLRPALRDLSALADVVSRTDNADDVTASFVNARSRIQELNAERRGLLRRLENANSDRAASAIRARLRIVNAEIASQTQGLADLRRRTSYASVAVTLETKSGGSGGGGIGSGARDLRDSLVAAANLSLRVVGVALPIGILIALLWAAGGWFNRRRREAVLD